MIAFLAQCAQVAVPEATPLAMSYYKSGNLLWCLSLFLSFAIPALFLWTGWSARLAQIGGKAKGWYFRLAIYLLLFIPLFELIGFPLDLYKGYFREHAYHLSNQPLSAYLIDWGKSLLILLIAALAFVWIFYLLIRKSPKRWWFYGSFVSIVITFFAIFITPLWISPLFHHFGPMKNESLEQQILSLASKAGIEGARVFEVDMSQETKTLNAYVTGFGSSKRIVLWDTIIAALSPDQLLFVMGHEMGHYVLHHIWWLLAFSSLSTFLLFYLTYRFASWMAITFQDRFRFKSLSEFASLPLLLLSFTLFQFLLSPLQNAFSRHLEMEADRYGLTITKNNQAAGEAFLALQQTNLANPAPGKLYLFFRASHPPLKERIEMANRYCPWDMP